MKKKDKLLKKINKYLIELRKFKLVFIRIKKKAIYMKMTTLVSFVFIYGLILSSMFFLLINSIYDTLVIIVNFFLTGVVSYFFGNFMTRYDMLEKECDKEIDDLDHKIDELQYNKGYLELFGDKFG